LDAVSLHMRQETALALGACHKQRDALRPRIGVLRACHIGQARRQKLGEETDEIEDQDDDRRGDRHADAGETVPDEPPLAGNGGVVGPGAGPYGADGRPLLERVCQDFGRHQWNLIRGSSKASNRSEMSIPISVSTPISRMKLPARYMS